MIDGTKALKIVAGVLLVAAFVAMAVVQFIPKEGMDIDDKSTYWMTCYDRGVDNCARRFWDWDTNTVCYMTDTDISCVPYVGHYCKTQMALDEVMAARGKGQKHACDVGPVQPVVWENE